jgi:alpha-tubulin suppressor-like RCC1 family protein
MLRCSTKNQQISFWEKITSEKNDSPSPYRLKRNKKSNKTIILTFGNNSHGQLGLKNFINRSRPEKLETNIEFVEVVTGYDTSAGITVNGKVYIWGNTKRFGESSEKEKNGDQAYPSEVRVILRSCSMSDTNL